MNKCPICNKKLIELYRDTLDGRITLETLYECPEKHYAEEFVTGYTCSHLNRKRYLPASYRNGYKPKFKDRLIYNVVLFWYKAKWKLNNA